MCLFINLTSDIVIRCITGCVVQKLFCYPQDLQPTISLPVHKRNLFNWTRILLLDSKGKNCVMVGMQGKRVPRHNCVIKIVKAVHVEGRGSPEDRETSRFPYIVDKRLTYGGEVVSLTHRLPTTPRKISDTHTSATVRLEGLGQLKDPMTSSRIKFAIFRVVAQFLKELHYRVPITVYCSAEIVQFVMQTDVLYIICRFWLCSTSHYQPSLTRQPQ